MKRFQVWLSCLAGFAGVLVSAPAAETNGAPNLQEVLGLLRANLPGVTEAELNRAAVTGLLRELKGRAELAGDKTAAPEKEAPSLAATNMLDGVIGYIRFARISTDAEKAFETGWAALSSSNKLKGVVIDLRFAGGNDYAGAAGVAGRFADADQPLFKVAGKELQARRPASPITLPVAVLVNKETAGAAEVLAASLRQIEAGVLIGSTTAGLAHSFKDFPLSDGRVLKIGSDLIEMTKGGPLTGKGIAPDIEVSTAPADEREYIKDPYRSLAGGVAGQSSPTPFKTTASARASSRPRLNEAELVRRQREGSVTNREPIPAPTPEPPAKPAIQDPALARAIDLLKGIAAVEGRRAAGK